MTFAQDNKTTSTLNEDLRGVPATAYRPIGLLLALLHSVTAYVANTLTQDNKSVSTLTLDDRSTSSITQDNKTTAGSLWGTVYPWTLDFPWMWEGNGQVLTLDNRNV